MIRFKKILCPIDFSECSRTALRYAARIARGSRGRLIVLSINDPLLVAAAIATYDKATLARTTYAELRQFVRKSVVDRSLARQLHCSVGLGKPAGEILKAAKSLRADLIVMGTHGLSGVPRLLIGSTTEYVLRHAETPVLAIPGLFHNGAAPPPDWPGRHVITPTGLGLRALAEMRAAAGVARAFGAHLTLVHIVTGFVPPPWYRHGLAAHHRIRAEKAREHIERLASEAGPGVVGGTLVVAGSPADEIAAVAALRRTGLIIVTSSRSRHGFLGSHTGGLVYRVLCHGVAPVLALPAAWPSAGARTKAA